MLPSCAYTLTAATVTVSGYAAVMATAIYRDGDFVGSVTGSVDLAQLGLVPAPDLNRHGTGICHHCNGRAPTLDVRLGVRAWCTGCVTEAIPGVIAQHGRLPSADEFWCPLCTGLFAVTDLASREGGRTRFCCRTCQRARWRRRKAVAA